MQQAIAFEKHPVRPVDQDFGHGGIAQQHLQRAEAGQLIDDFLGQPFHLITGNCQMQARHVLADLVDDELGKRLA